MGVREAPEEGEIDEAGESGDGKPSKPSKEADLSASTPKKLAKRGPGDIMGHGEMEMDGNKETPDGSMQDSVAPISESPPKTAEAIMVGEPEPARGSARNLFLEPLIQLDQELPEAIRAKVLASTPTIDALYMGLTFFMIKETEGALSVKEAFRCLAAYEDAGHLTLHESTPLPPEDADGRGGSVWGTQMKFGTVTGVTVRGLIVRLSQGVSSAEANRRDRLAWEGLTSAAQGNGVDQPQLWNAISLAQSAHHATCRIMAHGSWGSGSMYSQHQLFCNGSVDLIGETLGTAATPANGIFSYDCQNKSKGSWLVMWHANEIPQALQLLGRMAALLPDSKASAPVGFTSQLLRPITALQLAEGDSKAVRESSNLGKMIVFGLQFRTLIEYQMAVATLITKHTSYQDVDMLFSRMTALPMAKTPRMIQGLLISTDDAHMTSAFWNALEHRHVQGTVRLGSTRVFMRHCNCSICMKTGCLRCGSNEHLARLCPSNKQVTCLECFENHLEGPTARSMIDCAKNNRLTMEAVRDYHEAFQCHICGCTAHPTSDCNVLAYNLPVSERIVVPLPVLQSLRKAGLNVDTENNAIIRTAADRNTDAEIARKHAKRMEKQRVRPSDVESQVDDQTTLVDTELASSTSLVKTLDGAWAPGGKHAQIMEDEAVARATQQMALTHQTEMHSWREAFENMYGAQVTELKQMQGRLQERQGRMEQQVHGLQEQVTSSHRQTHNLLHQLLQKVEVQSIKPQQQHFLPMHPQQSPNAQHMEYYHPHMMQHHQLQQLQMQNQMQTHQQMQMVPPPQQYPPEYQGRRPSMQSTSSTASRSTNEYAQRLSEEFQQLTSGKSGEREDDETSVPSSETTSTQSEESHRRRTSVSPSIQKASKSRQSIIHAERIIHSPHRKET